MKIKIKDIKWGDRARKDQGDIYELARDIKRLGLIHPIVLDEDHNLLAGGRRLGALIINEVEELEKDKHYRYMSELSPLEKKEVELTENLQRKNLLWAEEIALKAELHELRERLAKEKGEEWSAHGTAKEWGQSPEKIRRDLELAKFVMDKPELKKEVERGTAYSKMKRVKEEHRRSINIASNKRPDNLHYGNCIEIMRGFKEHSVDLVLLDPPYGVELDGTENISASHKMFFDTKEHAMQLLEDVLEEVKRVLKIGAHCYVFYAIWYHCDILPLVQKSLGGMQVNPLFWVKTNGAGNKMPFKRFTLVYEPFLFCWNFSKQRDLTERYDNIFNYAWEVGKKHPTQKPLSLYKKLIQLSTFPGEVVLDPMAGSGNAVKAAIEMGRVGIGIEKDKDFYNLMVENVTGEI